VGAALRHRIVSQASETCAAAAPASLADVEARSRGWAVMRGTLVAGALSVSSALLPWSAAAADRDCADFSSQREAQEYFESKGGPSSDPDRLDADGDGKACDSLPCPCGSGSPSPSPRPAPRPPKKVAFRARITDVTDGDTIKVRRRGGKRYRVRLIGIDTPETKRPGTALECGGRQATALMFLLGFTAPRDTDGDGLFDAKGGTGRKVTVKTDTTQDRRDRYGRLLAYVATSQGNLARLSIRQGWGEVYVFETRFRLYDRFKAAQDAAKSEGKGVWSLCAGDFHRPA
jgi:endonuclease YncB( thermonuclease family)